MIVDGNKMHLTRDEYRNLRENMDDWEWAEYAKLRPSNLDWYVFMGGKIVACIENVMVYVDQDDDFAITVERIERLTHAR